MEAHAGESIEKSRLTEESVRIRGERVRELGMDPKNHPQRREFDVDRPECRHDTPSQSDGSGNDASGDWVDPDAMSQLCIEETPIRAGIDQERNPRREAARRAIDETRIHAGAPELDPGKSRVLELHSALPRLPANTTGTATGIFVRTIDESSEEAPLDAIA